MLTAVEIFELRHFYVYQTGTRLSPSDSGKSHNTRCNTPMKATVQACVRHISMGKTEKTIQVVHFILVTRTPCRPASGVPQPCRVGGKGCQRHPPQPYLAIHCCHHRCTTGHPQRTCSAPSSVVATNHLQTGASLRSSHTQGCGHMGCCRCAPR